MDPKTHISRWFILSLCSVIILGSYFAYDVPAALSLQLHEYLEEENESFQYYLQLLYSLYSIPNLVLPFFGGYFIDKLGNRWILTATALLTAMGQFLFTFGLFLKNKCIMYLGRLIMGIGKYF